MAVNAALRMTIHSRHVPLSVLWILISLIIRVDSILPSCCWFQDSKLVALDGAADDKAGFAVSLYENTLLVGAPFKNQGEGKVYVYTTENYTWTYITDIPYDDANDFSNFGASVVLKDETAVVGAVRIDAVYVYNGGGDTWEQKTKLEAPDGDPILNEFFGQVVDIEDDLIIVGAPNANIVVGDATYVNGGAVYVFIETGGWQFGAKLVASDVGTKYYFGNDISIDEDTIVVGAPRLETNSGSAYVYVRTGFNTFFEQAILYPYQQTLTDRFGFSVAIQQDTIVVGAKQDDRQFGPTENVGKAYVFTRYANIWVQEQVLVGPLTTQDDNFGNDISIYGDRMAISSVQAGLGNPGTVYMFRKNARSGKWKFEKKITGRETGLSVGDEFGFSVSLYDQILAVGSDQDDSPGASKAGAVYVYHKFNIPPLRRPSNSTAR